MADEVGGEGRGLRVVIPDDYQGVALDLDCAALLKPFDVTTYRDPAPDFETLVARLQDAEVIVAIRERVTFSRELIARLPKLRLIALVGRHSRMIDPAACAEHGVMVATGQSGSPVSPAELTVALIVASRRNVAIESERMRRGDLPYTLSHRLQGSTLGIFGLGSIGSLVAKAGVGLGMEILVWGREGSLERARKAGYRPASSQAAFFEEADVVSLHMPLFPDTRGIVGPDDLARMKPTALLVNTARAGLVQPGALLEALQRGRPGYAAFDVYEEEPILGGDHPYLRMPNVLCMPHLGWADRNTFELYFGEAYEQIVAYTEGRPLRLLDFNLASRLRGS